MEVYSRVKYVLAPAVFIVFALVVFASMALSQQVELQAAPEATISASEKRQIQEEVAPAQSKPERAIFVDTRSLVKKGQILVVTLDRQHCISVSIFARRLGGLDKLLSIDRLPSGLPICSSGAHCPGPSAAARPGRITISYGVENPNRNGCTISRVQYDPKRP